MAMVSLNAIVLEPRAAKTVSEISTIASLLAQNAVVQSALVARFAELVAATRETLPAGKSSMDLRQLSDYSGRSVTWLRQQIHRFDDPLPHQQPHGRGSKITVKPSDYDSWSSRQTAEINVKNLVADVTRRVRSGRPLGGDAVSVRPTRNTGPKG